MPARCQSCGHTFDGAGGIHIEGAANVTLSNNTITCPRCGRPAQMIEGAFNVTSGGIEMIEGPKWTKDLLDELGLTLQRIVEEKPHDPIAAVENVDSRLGAALRKVTHGWSKTDVLTLIATLLLALQYFGVQASDLADAASDARQAVEELLREAARSGPPGPASPQTPGTEPLPPE